MPKDWQHGTRDRTHEPKPFERSRSLYDSIPRLQRAAP